METIDQILEIITALGTLVALAALVFEITSKHKKDKQNQALQISVWGHSVQKGRQTKSYVIVNNMSDLSIYDVVVSVDNFEKGLKGLGTQDNKCYYIETLAPGRYYCNVANPEYEEGVIYNSSISFRDARNINWTRDASGRLHCDNKKSSIKVRKLTNKKRACFYEMQDSSDLPME